MSGYQVNLEVLRQRAERALERRGPGSGDPADGLRDTDASRLVEELRIYQTELEIQNQELSGAQSEISLTLEKYRALFDNLPLPAIVADAQGFIVEANLQASQLLGLHRSAGLQHRSVLLLFDIDSRSHLYPALGSHSGSAPRTVELLGLNTANGETIPCDVHVIHLQEESPHEGRILLVLVDQSTEMALRDSEARYGAVFLEAKAVMLMVDPETGQIIEANPAAQHFYGYDSARIRQMNIAEINTLTPTEIAAEMRRAKSEWRDHFFFPHRLASGEIRHVEVYSGPFRHGGRSVLYSIVHDVTERKLAEEALHRESEKNRALLRNASDGIHILDTAGKLLEASDSFCAMLGYDREELIGSHVTLWDSRFNDVELGEVIRAQFVRNGRSLFETRHRRKDGTSFDVEISGFPLELEGKAVLFNSSRDISERKRSEQRLTQSEQRMDLALAGADLGLWDMDIAQDRVNHNARLMEMIGVAPGEIEPSRKTFESLAHPDDLGSFAAAYFAHLKGETPRFEAELRVRHKDGHWVWVLARGKVVERDANGYALRVTGTNLDITERKRAEAELAQYRFHLEELVEQRTAALLETEERASHILKSSADGLYGVDNDGTVTFINPAACTLLGYSAEEVIGHSAHELFHHSRPDGTPYPASECPGHHAVCVGEQIRVGDEVYWHKDGHAIPVMYAVHPMVQNGFNTGSVISFVDISEQRAAAKARELALAAAENLARVRSEFLSNMSHEIRTPLNGVLGFAEIGFRNYQNAEKARSSFAKIQASGQRLLGVINDILDFSKVEAGKLSVEKSEVILSEVIDHAIDLVADRAASKQLALCVERAADLPVRCISDSLRMGQVLLNLLSNAIKFTDSGSVTLSVSRRGDSLFFKVTDTGIGIADEQLGELFNPFQQADGSTTRKYGGTGLGLAISKRILELMGGDIRVESRLGAGSTFEFRLPYVEPTTPPVRVIHGHMRAASGATKPLAGISILVAEDDQVNRLVLEENLIDDGARVVMVGNGREAVERVISDGCTAYDIVLMDIQMPEMDGYEATRRLRQLAPDLPVIGQTAHALEEERQKCLEAGMVGHIAKPIEADLLVKLIRQHASARTGQ